MEKRAVSPMPERVYFSSIVSFILNLLHGTVFAPINSKNKEIMKKLMLIIGFVVCSLFMSCSIFVHTPVASGGAKVGSTQTAHPDSSLKTSK